MSTKGRIDDSILIDRILNGEKEFYEKLMRKYNDGQLICNAYTE